MKIPARIPARSIYSKLLHLVLISAIFSVCAENIYAQNNNVSINTTGNAPDASAGLDVDFSNKGLLIPRVELDSITDTLTIDNPATSLLVYNTATAGTYPNEVAPGYYYWNGTKWVSFRGWRLTGNAGTAAGNDFIGTTDSVDFVIKTNNSERLRIGADGNIDMGASATTPTVIGGTNTTSSLELRSTSGIGSGDFIKLTVGNNGTTEAVRIKSTIANLATSYENSGGSGNRTSSITMSTTCSVSGSLTTVAINGNTSDQTAYFQTQAASEKVIKFDFGSGSSKVIQEVKIYTSAGTYSFSPTFVWQGSNDDANWTSIGSNFSFTSGTMTISTMAGATTGYRYFRMLGQSGSFSINSDPWFNEVEFKIANDSTVATFNIGVGVSSPTARIHLKEGTGESSSAPLKLSSGTNLATPEAGAIEYDGTALTYTTSTPARIRLLGNSLGISGGTTFIGGTGTTDDLILRTTSGAGTTGADMIFQAGNNGGTEVMRILNSGSIGIGTSSPSATLHVIGGARISSLPTISSGEVAVYWDSSTGELRKQTSSGKYKTNVQNLSFNKDSVLNLRPVQFTRINSGKTDIGLIAEEVEQTMPELVYYEHKLDTVGTVTDTIRTEIGRVENVEIVTKYITEYDTTQNVVEGVLYQKLPVYLLSIIQEQEQRINDQDTLIQNLKARIEALEAQ